ncbi:Tlg2-vesicle protein [Saitozyma podzolica]|uniref:Golgi apparatus membrane protein TVP38 n=1 Tax=Saitozyma podzolica TaxID=1890683 RepID=A0A427YV58_9TREE|nr:Tlg2-vesicle protein [Saitozyma podzolica]
MRGLADNASQRNVGWIERAKSMPERISDRYQRLSKRSKTILWAVAALHVVIFAAIAIITPSRIGRWFNEFAVWIRSLGAWGVVVCGLLVVLSSHPPLFGFSASMSLIGFAYGVWPGFLIASIGSLLGGAFAFLSVRTFFPGIIRSHPSWDAFGRVMREKGTILVIMIRYCPMPWAIGNGLFASIESVKFWQVMLADLLILPRLMIPVFIGSRLTSLADPDATHDPVHTWLNVLSIGLSMSFSVGTGIFIYRATLAQMRKLDGEGGERAAEALEELEEGLLAGYSDETGGLEEAEALVVVSPQATGAVESPRLGNGLIKDSAPALQRRTSSQGSSS